jgi:hypothetical protein
MDQAGSGIELSSTRLGGPSATIRSVKGRDDLVLTAGGRREQGETLLGVSGPLFREQGSKLQPRPPSVRSRVADLIYAAIVLRRGYVITSRSR